MSQNTVSTGFSMYSPRRLERKAFGNFKGTTINQFDDATSQNPENYQQLLNIMSTVDGAFTRRWPLTEQTPITGPNIYRRMYTYAAAADVTFTGTADTRLVLASDNHHVNLVYDEEGPGTISALDVFTSSADIWGVTSRSWFYSCNGVDTPKKINYSQGLSDTNSTWGIGTPTASIVAGVTVGISGQNYTVPTVVITGGGGSGATATASLTDGGVWIVGLNTTGSGYTTPPSVTITDTGSGSGAAFVAVIGTDSTHTLSYQKVIAIVMTGPIILNAGRQYAIALQNSVTGHTSDFTAAASPSRYIPSAPSISDPKDDPSLWLTQGAGSIAVPITIADSTVDAQVDTVVLMATSDGGDLEHLYEVAIIPLSSFTHGGGNYTLVYYDTLPDTYNDVYTSGPTLLTQNLWVDVDVNGDVIGINDNTPPPNIITKPVIHKGRLFATDGKSLFFSKSIDEVTTSTGLITSKWEEAWPGSNQLDIAYDDEAIQALLSDGSVLYTGTSDNIFRLLGDSASNFSIPEAIFRGVGVQGQDVWSVIYKDGIPAGYTWVTPDFKIMLSDFNTYQEIGQPIYPSLQELNYPITHVQSISYGPYSLIFYSAESAGSPFFWVFDSKNGGWYWWEREVPFPSGPIGPQPLLSYTTVGGVQNMLALLSADTGGGLVNSLQYFNPNTSTFIDAALAGNAATGFAWTVQSSWLSLSDTATSSVVNEVELWTDDFTTNVAVHIAQSEQDFRTPTLAKSGPFVIGPLKVQKFYLAGSNSFGRFHRVTFTGTSGSTTRIVLRQYQFEYFPQTRS